VPQTRLAWQPALNSPGRYWLDYGTIYRVSDRADDTSGRAWYRLVDDDGEPRLWWVEARHVRHLTEADFAPIAPGVPASDKRIEVSIGAQTLTCYEGDTIVFATRIASGTGYINAEGVQFGFDTPLGEHKVLHKRPTRHMVGGDPQNPHNYYDLPGVPWCSYFTATGAAIHGTYWHNNFGKPQSHGCINAPTDAARWVYRWTNPVRGDRADFGWDAAPAAGATRVIVT
jgi:L,D-transpeptidase catalytic domain